MDETIINKEPGTNEKPPLSKQILIKNKRKKYVINICKISKLGNFGKGLQK